MHRAVYTINTKKEAEKENKFVDYFD